MKAILTFEFTVDGEITPDELEAAFLSKAQGSVITSESVDGTDRWAVLLDSVEVEISEE